MHKLLEGLNEKQQAAVVQTEGPVLIIAGAGSGKTKALTHRIAYLIQEKGVDPAHILAVTFTNKAANEMKHRVEELLGNMPAYPTVGTFHSICVRILRREIHHIGYENSFTIYDYADQIALMKNIFKERGINTKQYQPKAVLGAISNAKNELIDPERFVRLAHSPFQNLVAEVYPVYQKQLKLSGALDFDDLIMKTVELFQTQQAILTKYQERFKYISVDEYQDTNNAQYKLVHLLADKYKNICVIGDDWQSIYSWRGANMQNILDFEKDYPETKIIKMEQNYRSTDVIVQAANVVIKNNEKRSDKELWTENKSEDKIKIFEATDERMEAAKVAQYVEETMKTRDARHQDFAVLYRTNAQSRSLEETFMRYGIPYKIVGGVKFYERKEIKDVLAYIRLVLNPHDNISLLRVINTPARKIGAKTIEVLSEYAKNLNLSLYEVIESSGDIGELTPRALSSLQQFFHLIQDLRKVNKEFPASGVIKQAISLSGYKNFLLDGTDEGEERFHNVEELISVATKYDALEAGISLATFLEEVALVSDVDSLNDTDQAVTLMTLHSSKGLEFPYVCIVGLEEGMFPSNRSQLDPNALEEERRLMYVGMTRAKQELVLSFSNSRMLYGEFQYYTPSRFLSEIPDEYLSFPGKLKQADNLIDSAFEEEVHYVDIDEYEMPTFEVGDNVQHAKWGLGKVMEVQGDILTIAFKNPLYGRKRVAANIAPITKVA